MSKQLAQLEADAQRQNAIPLLLYILGNDTASLPQTLRSLSRTQYIQNYLANSLLLRELKEVLNSFARERVAVIVLKGSALNIDVYPRLGLRPMRDIDLLIHLEELGKATEIMHTLGYQPCLPPARNRIEKFQGEVVYRKSADFPIILEPHWTLGPEYPYAGKIKVEGLWQRARRVNLAGVQASVLCPEDSLLHECLHLFQHNRDFWLIPACDIVELSRQFRDSIDWQALLNRALEFELSLPLKYSLEKTDEIFHPPVPRFLFGGLGSYKPRRSEKRIFDLLSGGSGPIGSGNLVKVMTIPGITQRLVYLYSILFPSKEWLIYHYSKPDWGIAGLYVAHLKNVFRVGSRVLLRFFLLQKPMV